MTHICTQTKKIFKLKEFFNVFLHFSIKNCLFVVDIFFSYKNYFEIAAETSTALEAVGGASLDKRLLTIVLFTDVVVVVVAVEAAVPPLLECLCGPLTVLLLPLEFTVADGLDLFCVDDDDDDEVFEDLASLAGSRSPEAGGEDARGALDITLGFNWSPSLLLTL